MYPGSITKKEFDRRLERAIADFRKIFPDADYETSCEKVNGLWQGRIRFFTDKATANIDLLFQQFDACWALKLCDAIALTKLDHYSVQDESWANGGTKDNKKMLTKLEKTAIRLLDVFFEDGVDPSFLMGLASV